MTKKKCRKDAGASCNTSEECPINYATKGDATKPKYRYFCDQTTKTCKVSTEQGGSLGYECKEGINSCAQGLKCVKNKCAVGENNDAGARCENESQCKDPLRCISQKCAVAPKKIGDECAKNEDCPRNASCKTLTADTKKVCKQDRPVTGTDNPDNATASATPISVQCSNNVADRGYFTTGLTNECINCGRCTICDFMNVIQGVINGILGVVGLIAMFMLILGAGTYTNAAGNPKKMEAAKAQITTAIIGLLIAIGSWAIVTAVMRGLSASATGTWYRPKFECRADAWKSQSILNRTP